MVFVVTSDERYPDLTPAPLPEWWLACSPAMVLPMLMASARGGLGTISRPFASDFNAFAKLARYWLCLASAAHVTQRPIALLASSD